MHIALAFFVVDTVEQLSIAHLTQGNDGHDLRLTAGEQTGAVHAGSRLT